VISINWSTKVISVPQADLSLVSGTLYELDVDAFRLELKGIEDSEEGMAFDATHQHNTAVTLSGVTYARTFEIINGYTVTFQDTGSPYTVRCVGANHNIADVTNYSSEVSLIVGNSAGLIAVATGAGPSAADIAAAVLAAMNTTPPGVDVKKMNGATVIGTGTVGDGWRGVGVPP
jgi:hypothetical protein